eukprot:TRINITY_DN2486_c0_g1_i1.p2 TRINITY_DN2486_c0_g1~~TRINITY_DN2486_c0_g1_i1.p2  ORF type:complete len:345 (+),score=112.84 TRINITY_DN2486_c0_g1_i1:171-1205(+)
MTGTLVSALRALPAAAAAVDASLPTWAVVVGAAAGWAAALSPSAVLSTRLSASYRELSSPVRVEWLSRVVSNLHAVILTPALAVTVFGDAALAAGVPFSSGPEVHALLKVGLGYFLYDALLVSAYRRTISAPGQTLFHHALVLSSVSWVLYSKLPLATVWAALLFLTEASTPFVNQRWFMAFRHRQSGAYKVTGLAMTLAFFAARPLYIPFACGWMLKHRVLYSGLTTYQLRVLLAIGVTVTVGLYGLNIYWFSLMARGLVKAFRGSSGGASAAAGRRSHVGAGGNATASATGALAVAGADATLRRHGPSPTSVAVNPDSAWIQKDGALRPSTNGLLKRRQPVS